MSFLKNIKTPDDLLQEYKETKVNQVNALRDSKLDTFVYNGVEFQTRPTDRENIMGEAINLALDGGDADIEWIAADNSIVVFTPAEFISFAKAVGEAKRDCIFKGREMKDAILAATTREEVDAITWPDHDQEAE